MEKRHVLADLIYLLLLCHQVSDDFLGNFEVKYVLTSFSILIFLLSATAICKDQPR